MGTSLMCPVTHTISIVDFPLGGSMRVTKNDKEDRAELHGYVQFNRYIHTHTHTGGTK